MKMYGGVDANIHIFLTSTIDGDELYVSHLPPPNSQWIGGWNRGRSSGHYRLKNSLFSK
jgi:hypothetical protein